MGVGEMRRRHIFYTTPMLVIQYGTKCGLFLSTTVRHFEDWSHGWRVKLDLSPQHSSSSGRMP